MTKEQLIRRYIYIRDEVRFLNSDKPYISVTFIGGVKQPKISMSKYKTDGCYTRKQFEALLNDRSWINVLKEIK